jgi:hypothetical protein
MCVTVAGLIVAGSIVVTAGVLLWSAGFHAGWRQARQAELRRVRERQRRLGEHTARPRRSTRL